MANVSPFKALHYNPTKLPTMSELICPPYDAIPKGEEAKYLNRSPYNFAHVILPRVGDDNYVVANETLRKWREIGVLKEDPTPGFYVYQQRFQMDDVTHVRQTLMGTVKLVDFKEAVVRPHENTFNKYKEDRLKILRATRCNLSHIFAMVKDPEGFLQTVWESAVFQEPLLTGMSDEGVEHAIWRLPTSQNAAISAFFQDKPIYIVDGHHRYESALRYARELGVEGKDDHPAAHMLFSIANTFDPALVVLPTHRIVKNVPTDKLAQLSKEFHLEEKTTEWLYDFVKRPTPVPAFGLYYGGKLYRCSPSHPHQEEKNWGKALSKLAVKWSDHRLLSDYCGVNDDNRAEKVSYDKDARAVWEKRDEATLVIFHAPPAVEEIAHIADEKGFMPQKSTYFFPKLAAGFIFRALA